MKNFILKKIRDSHLLFFLACCGLGSIIGYVWIWKLQDYYISFDSAWHVLMSYELTWNILDHVSWDAHPPLYYFFLKLVMSVFGVNNPVVLRSVSLFFGVLTVITTYLIGKRLSISKWVGLMAAFLLGTSPLFILLSQVIRNYTILIFFISLFYMLALKKELYFRDFFFAGILITLITFTHYASVVLLPTFLVFGLFRIFQKNKKIRFLFLWFIFICFNFGFTLWMVSQRRLSWHQENLKLEAGQDVIKTLSTSWSLLKFSFGTYEVYIVSVLIFLGLFLLFKDKKKNLLLFFGGPILTALVLSLLNKYPLTAGRHSSYLLPTLFIPIIYGIHWIYKQQCLVLLFFAILSSQFIEKPNLYQIQLKRGQFNSELGPTIKELIMVKEKLKTKLAGGPILVDFYFGMSVHLEQLIRPNWAIFLDIEKKIMNCAFRPIYLGRVFNFYPIWGQCSCLSDRELRDNYTLLVDKDLKKGTVGAFRDCLIMQSEERATTNYFLISMFPARQAKK